MDSRSIRLGDVIVYQAVPIFPVRTGRVTKISGRMGDNVIVKVWVDNDHAEDAYIRPEIIKRIIS